MFDNSKTFFISGKPFHKLPFIIMSEDQHIHVECPHCENKIKAPEEYRGKPLECPSCDGKLRIPEEEHAPSSEAAPTDHNQNPSTNTEQSTVDEEYFERFEQVARYQKYVLWLVFFAFAAGVASIYYSWASYIQFGIGIGQILAVYQLASALNFGTISTILFTAGQIIPCLNLILMLVLVRRASNLISELDVGVGLMGADLDEVRNKTKQMKNENLAQLFE